MQKRFDIGQHSIALWQILLIVLCFSTDGFTQSVQIGRFEREQKNTDQEFILISMKDEGIALVRDNEKYKDGKQLWQVIRLDTTLQEIWSIELDIENRLRLVGYEYKDNLIYLLYRTGEHEAASLTLFTIHAGTQQINRYTIEQELSFKVTHFSALANSIVLGGYVTSEPAVLLYNLNDEKMKLVPGFFVSDTELLDLRINTNYTFNTLIADRNTKQAKRLVLKTFDGSGAMLLEDVIEIDSKKTILTAMTSTLVNDEMLIVGTWTEGTSKQASGIFTSLVDPFSDQPITYYDFGQFDHFLGYLKEKRVASLKERSQQANKLGEIPDFKTYAVPLRVEEQPNGFALLTEVYQPSSSLNSYPYWNNNFGTPSYGYTPYGYNPFMNRYYNAPYQYNNNTPAGETKMLYASLMLFDLRGKLTGDYGLKLEDKKSAGLEQTSDFIYTKDHVALAYKKEKEININRILSGGVVESDTLQAKLPNETDFIRNDSEYNSTIRFWYRNIFYVSGYQSIRDRSGNAEDPIRYVFYINKIEVR